MHDWIGSDSIYLVKWGPASGKSNEGGRCTLMMESTAMKTSRLKTWTRASSTGINVIENDYYDFSLELGNIRYSMRFDILFVINKYHKVSFACRALNDKRMTFKYI